MAKLTDFQNPLSGKTQSIFDIGGIWSLALGAGVLLFITSVGQKLLGGIHNRVPSIPGQPGPLFSTPVVVNQVTTKRVI